jgi:adhesin/invasin
VSRRLASLVLLVLVAAAGASTPFSAASFTTMSSVTVQASASPVTQDTLQVNTGNGQSATVGTAVTTAPSVRVTDKNSNPVSGIVVTFAVASGGGSATGLSATTNASGIAAVGSWTLGTTAGANTLTASVAGLIGSPVTFTATGVAGAATRYLVTSSSYGPVAGTAVTVSAQLADQYGNPVASSGRSVTWTKTGTGGTFSANPTTTNTSGIATVVFTTGTVAGVTYAVTATSTGASGTSANIVTVAGAAATIAISAGNGQSATVGTAVTTAPSVRVADANNNPVSGVVVTFAVASGGGSATGLSATTDASGIATVGSWTLGTTVGANTLTATRTGLTGSPVTFTATGLVGAATHYNVTSSSYGPVAGTAVTVSAQLADQYDNAVASSGRSVTWTKTGTGGTFGTNPSTTNASGIATVVFTTGTVAGVTYTVTATSTGATGTSTAIVTIAGAATKIALSAGNAQSVTVGTAVPVAPSVLVSDANNNPVAGVVVSFSVYTGGGSGTGLSATTDASGIATVGSWTLGTTAGANSMRATRTGLTGSPVTFTATGLVGPASQFRVTSSNYSPLANRTVTITGRLADQYGNYVTTSGVSVTWTKTGTGGSFTTANPSTTNTAGTATVTFRVSTTVGMVHTVTATGGGVTGTSPAITTR